MDAVTSSFRLECATDLGSGLLPVFPVLMPASWRPPAMTTLSRPLVSEMLLPEMPVVTLAYLVPMADSAVPNRVFIRAHQPRYLGKSTDDFYREAIHNVARRPAAWTAVGMFGTRLAVCEDDYLAAERVLDPEFLREAHRLLGDDELCVGIPARGQLWAMPMRAARADPLCLRSFALMVANQFDAAQNMPIAPWPFTVANGQLGVALDLGCAA
jgi:hypothetical protein